MLLEKVNGETGKGIVEKLIYKLALVVCVGVCQNTRICNKAKKGSLVVRFVCNEMEIVD